MTKVFLILMLAGCSSYAQNVKSILEENLTPTQIPKVFFEGNVSLRNSVQWNNSFTDNGKEIVYTIAQKGKPSYLVTQSWKDGKFTQPQKNLLDSAFPHSDPHFSPNGEYYIFSSAKALFEGDTAQRNFYFWKSKKDTDGWKEPELIRWEDFDNGCFYPSMTENQDLYFSYNEKEGERNSNIYKSVWNGESYETPQKLPSIINSIKFEGDPFIDRKEHFLIFAGFDREENYGKSDLYISFLEDGEWTSPVNLGSEINSHGFDGSPYVTPNEKYLIFTSSRTPDGSEEEEFFNVFYVSIDLEKYRQINTKQ